MKDFCEYVSGIELTMKAAGKIGVPAKECAPIRTIDASKRPVLMIMPHPDDEMIVGALALRLLKEEGRRVIVLCATLGSNRDRQPARLSELQNACAYIGFEARTIGARGLEGITPDAPKNPARWNAAVEAVAMVIAETRPEIVFLPHEKDGNRTHVGVAILAAEAVKLAAIPCHVFETEFWAAMKDPNLAAQSSAEDVAELISALSLHAGEVARNPYHLRLPMWMIDNVRRGAELVGGQGGHAPDFTFATLYRHSIFDGENTKRVVKNEFFGTNDLTKNLFDV
jgi:N-acetylglucosamine malate deacetylase 1